MDSNTSYPSEFELEKTLLEKDSIPDSWKNDPLLSKRIEDFEKSKKNFLEEHPFRRHETSILEKTTENDNVTPFRKRNKPLVRWAYSMLAAAALLFLSFYFFPPNQEEYLGTKGNLDFGFYYKNIAGVATEGKNGIALQAQDKIRFFYSSPVESYLLIVGLEESGKTTLYFPESGDKSTKVVSKQREILEATYALDSYKGKERFLAFFSKSPITFQEVKKIISDHRNDVNFLDRQNLISPGVTVLSFWIQKQ